MPGAANVGGTLSISTTAGASYPSTGVTIIQANSVAGTFKNVTASGLFVPLLSYDDPQTVTLTLLPMVNSSQLQSLQIGPPILLGAANQNNWTIQRQQVNLISRIQDNGAFAASPDEEDNMQEPLPNLPSGGEIEYNSHTSKLTAYIELSRDSLDSRFLADDDTKKQKEQILVYRTALGERGHPGRFYIGPTATVGKVNGTNYIQDGAQAGVDYAFTEFGVGGLFSYDHYSAKGLLLDQASGTLYASYVPKKMPHIAVSGNFGYTYDWFLYHTRKGLEGDLHTARGTPKGMEYTGLLAFQYLFDIGQFKCTHQGLRISPYVNLEYTQINTDGFKEHGAGKFDVEVKKTTTKQLCSTLALYFIYYQEWNNVSIKPLVSVGWQRVLTQSISNIHLRPVDTHNPFTAFKVEKPGYNYANASADLQVYFFKKYGIEASWSFEWNKLFYDNEFFLGFSLMF
jgi:outer membrane autotransporter protein